MRKRTGKSRQLIRFHSTYLIMGVMFVLSGYFINLLVFTSLIVVHELGHYLMARILKFRVLEIVIYPYGGMTRIDDLVNRRIDEELLVASTGVIMQYLFYILVMYLYKAGYVREYTFNLYSLYNSRMIFFNLLPIYPLDGGRIVNLLLGKIVNYDLSNKLTIGVSLVMIMVIVGINLYKVNYSNIMIYLVLVSYLIDYMKNIKYLYRRFMLERYLYDIKFDKIKVINDSKGMYKDRYHLLYKDKKYIIEKDFLKELFN